jgi:uncharacterized protein HemX
VKDLKWPAVAVIGILLVVLGGLSYADKNATTVLAGVIAVLGALGFGYNYSKQSEMAQKQTETQGTVDAIKEQTNGRITDLMTMVEKQQRDHQATNDQHRRDMKEMAERLAQMMPPPFDPPVSGAGGIGHSANL